MIILNIIVFIRNTPPTDSKTYTLNDGKQNPNKRYFFFYTIIRVLFATVLAKYSYILVEPIRRYNFQVGASCTSN